MKRLLAIIALTVLAIGMRAQQLTELEAMDRALHYLNGHGASARALVGATSW